MEIFSMSLEQQVNQFNETYKKDMSPIPRLPTEPEATLMVDLIDEERMELKRAIDNGDLVEVADAIADILYVTAQQARLIGLPIDALLREVQRSNMSKLGADGKPVYREDGKVLKGPNFSEPDIAKVLRCYS
jgi:predicted HAD superfamily Cof-like phosphohydrolase